MLHEGFQALQAADRIRKRDKETIETMVDLAISMDPDDPSYDPESFYALIKLANHLKYPVALSPPPIESGDNTDNT